MPGVQTNSAPLSDAAESVVVGLAMLGDDAAFADLVRRRQALLRSFLRKLCGDRALADDLSQAVFLQAWRSISRLHTVAAYPAWLKKLAVNAWLQHVRASGRAVDLSPAADWDVVAAAVEHPDKAADLEAALRLLPAPVRLCLVLAHGEGMSHSEVARTAELPLGTVKSHIQRGGQRLRLILAAYRSH